MPRAGGGASREGAELELLYPDGCKKAVYMSHDTRGVGAGDDASFAREAAVLRAFSGPLRDRGVATAKLVAAIPEGRVLITEFVEGVSEFHRIKSEAERLAVAQDFMRQLALLHSIDVEKTAIEGMGAIEPASVTVRHVLRWLRARDNESNALSLLALSWLENNIPPEADRLVLVHGDAGPANFLYHERKVTALLDWELTHYGDPMEDLAMICIRNLFQPFVPLPQAFAAYEVAGGAPVDLDRVRYYRLYFQLRFTGNAAQFYNVNVAAPAEYCLRLMTTTIHLDVLATTLADVMGVPLTPITLPDLPIGLHHRSFETTIADMQDFVIPNVADQRGATRAKNVVRLIKWWRDIERYGPTFDRLELEELSAALGKRFDSLAEGRNALALAIATGAINREAAIRVCHARVARDRMLMWDAMGVMAKNGFAPLQ
jgi:thiamine kinase-like enzyme